MPVDGEYYRLDGAKRGPAPAHDIPIWLGALKPRMLRLVGRAADGWLPSLGYLKPGDLARGNAVIDESAANAGRDPREIRRLLSISGSFSSVRGGTLNGPSEQWVDELLSLALDEGIGTFILGSDEPAMLQQFAKEVAPALREAVGRERGSRGTAAGTIRSAAVRAKRREAIGYDNVPASLTDTAVEPGDSGYARVRSTYMRAGSPGIVLRPGTVTEVVDALAYARRHPDIRLGIRSGGHGISGRSTNDGGIIIDLSRMNAIDVLDEEARRVRIEAGARWNDVASALAPHGWAQLVLDASDPAALLRRWGAAVETAPRDLTSEIIMGALTPGRQAVAQVLAVIDSDDPDTIIDRLQPVADAAPIVDQSVQFVPYAGVMASVQGGDHDGQGEPHSRSGLIDHITPQFAAAAQRLLESGAVYFFQIRAVGGAVADVDPDATAYGNRSANFSVAAFGADEERLNTIWEEVYGHFTGLYLSFETDLRVARLDDAFPQQAIERLRALKSRYDPGNVFADNFNIEPISVS